MEHKIFKGNEFNAGISGKKIGIVGWSHHTNDVDREDLTIKVLFEVIHKTRDLSFFNQIPDYFEKDRQKFWNSVLFFNFLPQAVGLSNDRYADGTEEQADRGRERFLEILRDNQPDKVFVFTSRSPKFPEPAGNKFVPIRADLGKFYVASYKNSGHFGTTYFLRHPQGAHKSAMKAIVRHCMTTS